MDYSDTTDIVVDLTAAAEVLAGTGVTPGELDRFLRAWGRVLASAKESELPDGSLIVLAAPASEREPSQLPPDLLGWVQSERVEHHVPVIATDGSSRTFAPVSAQVLREVPGLRWTGSHASRASASPELKNHCLLLASGYEVRVFAKGVELLHYADARDQTLPSVLADRGRHGWSDGQHLRECGRHLSGRERIGIWRLPDHFLLKPRPEQLIEEHLDHFLRPRLAGYEQLIRQAMWESLGRVDLVVSMTDGFQYVVEIKWLGRSLGAPHEHVQEALLKEAVAGAWRCVYVTVMNDTDVTDSLAQLGRYMASRTAHRGYLVIYDCRRPDLVQFDEEAATRLAPPGMAPFEFRIMHVPVDPTVPSRGA